MWAVRLGTFSRYGHAAEVVFADLTPDVDLSVKIVEATPSGVRARWVHVSEFRWSTGGPLDNILTPDIRAELAHRAYAQIGKGYDWPSIARFIPRFFYAKYRGFSPDHPDRKLFCSELVVWNRREAGIDMFPGIAPRDVSPGDLQDWCPGSVGRS